jgi:hypothetical protein
VSFISALNFFRIPLGLRAHLADYRRPKLDNLPNLELALLLWETLRRFAN